MTAYYQTGASSSPLDFLGKIATFAVSNGFVSAGATDGIVLTATGIVLGMKNMASSIHMRGATGSNPAAAWNAQVNSPALMTCIMDFGGAVGPYTSYHLFGGDEDGNPYCHAVLELTSGVYRHMSFGRVVPRGTITGGFYVDAVNWNVSVPWADIIDSNFHHVIGDSAYTSGNGPHMRLDYDGKTNNFQQIISGYGEDNIRGNVRTNSMHMPLMNAQYMKWNLRTPPHRIEYFAGRPSDMYSPVGHIPNMAQINMRNISPAHELTLGGETWKCFPIAQRSDTFNLGTSVVSSGYYGYAYLMP